MALRASAGVRATDVMVNTVLLLRSSDLHGSFYFFK